METLGAVTHICTDKTGTLTRNRMTVTGLYLDGKNVPSVKPGQAKEVAPGSALSHLLTAAALCNDARMNNGNELSGDPTETALYALALDYGYEPVKLAAESPRLTELPFDAVRKCMTTVHDSPQGIIAYTKGGLEAILEKTTGIISASEVVLVDDAALVKANDDMAASGRGSWRWQ